MNLTEPEKGMAFSSRVLSIDESITVATTAKADALRRQGIDVISMSAGEPDFDTPWNIKDAAIGAIEQGFTKYTKPATGIVELKEAICDKLKRDNGLVYEPSQIVVGCGAKQPIFDAAVALINEGDEAIIPAPFWVSYADQVRLMGGVPVIVKTTAETGFRITPEQLKDALSPRTKFILFNSPCNPTGEVYTRSELQALAEIIADAGIYIVSDEIYEKILYDGADLLEMSIDERARAGIFLAFQYPVEIPGVNNTEFLKAAINAGRKDRGEEELDAMSMLKLVREKIQLVKMPPDLLKRSVNEGFSGGEKKKHEIFQMAVLEPRLAVLDETDSGLDIDALRIVADGVFGNQGESSPEADSRNHAHAGARGFGDDFSHHLDAAAVDRQTIGRHRTIHQERPR